MSYYNFFPDATDSWFFTEHWFKIKNIFEPFMSLKAENQFSESYNQNHYLFRLWVMSDYEWKILSLTIVT